MGILTRDNLRRLVREDSAQGMAEYALLAGLIAVVAITAISLLGNNIKNSLNNIATQVGNAS